MYIRRPIDPKRMLCLWVTRGGRLCENRYMQTRHASSITHAYSHTYTFCTCTYIQTYTHCTHILTYTHCTHVCSLHITCTHTGTHAHTHTNIYIYTDIHTYTYIQSTVGVWSCAVCGSEERASMLDCANRCRACHKCCLVREEDGSIVAHQCLDRQQILSRFLAMGISKNCVCLPDGGRGRSAWKFKWGDESRNFYGVRDPRAICDILFAEHDPLLHTDVVQLPV